MYAVAQILSIRERCFQLNKSRQVTQLCALALLPGLWLLIWGEHAVGQNGV